MDEKEITGSIHELKAQMKFIIETLQKLDAKFDRAVTRDVLDEKMKVQQMEIEILKQRVDHLQDDLDKYKEQQRDDRNRNKQIIPGWLNTALYIVTLIVGAALYLKR